MRFDYTSVRAEGGKVDDLLLDVSADLIVRAGSVIIWTEVDVPVVELGLYLSLWLRRGAQAVFSYDSMETEEPPFGWEPLADGSWLVRSRTAESRVSTVEITSAAARYLVSLARDCRDAFGIDIEAHYAEYPRR